MDKNQKHIDELIVDYLLGKKTADVLAELSEWIALSEQNQIYFARMQKVWHYSLQAIPDDRYDASAAYERFAARIAKETKAQKKPRTRISTILKYAAVACLLFSVCVFSYKWSEYQMTAAFADITIDVPHGSNSALTLPDGTLVTLNSGSSISYSQGFGMSDRKVHIEGEVYFEVTHDPTRPFYVESDGMQIQVLGTKFNIRNYSYDTQATVSLLEGRVCVSDMQNDCNNLILRPNQKVVMDKTTRRLVKSDAEAAKSVNWKSGVLRFDDMPLRDIVKELERSYNVKITLENASISSLHFYGVFDKKKQSVNDILISLASTGKFLYELQNDVHVIR